MFTSTPTAEILPFLILTNEINASLSAKPSMTFPEDDARQDNADVSWILLIVTSRPISRLKCKAGS